jgi:hypothetical protein
MPTFAGSARPILSRPRWRSGPSVSSLRASRGHTGPGGEPHAEDAPLDVDAAGLRAESVAGVAALEHSVLATPGLRGCVLRYGHIHGPGTGSDDAGGEAVSVHVEAAAWAAAFAFEKGALGAFNVAEPGDQVSTQRIERELGWHASLRV